MPELLFDSSGESVLLLDGHHLRDSAGTIVARIHGARVYSLGGKQWGWLQEGILYDHEKRPLAFLRNHRGHLPPARHVGAVVDSQRGPATRRGADWSPHQARDYFSR